MTTPRILLIGDDPNLLRTLRRNLVGRGYEVAIALDDEEALSILATFKPNLCVLSLDFTLVKVDALSLCSQLRQSTPSPIIVLSAMSSPQNEVRALDAGADDYLALPFGMEEFLARVRSSLRRSTTASTDADSEQQLIMVGDLLIDTEKRLIIRHSEQVHFTPIEYELLLYLVSHRGKVVSHRQLLQAVWGSEYGEEREYLRVFISQIRHKIEQDPLRPTYILTEPGVGYRFHD